MSNRATVLRSAKEVLSAQHKETGLYCSVLPGGVPMVHRGVRTRSTPKTGSKTPGTSHRSRKGQKSKKG